jgi:3',5'-cyclic AMP phosphodiesterase CpdA
MRRRLLHSGRATVLVISDLHVGVHSKELAQSLLRRAVALKPAVIVCCGDLAAEPNEHLLRQAAGYLEALQLASASSGLPLPKVLVVPGNHDYRKFGFLWRDRRGPYFKLFGQACTDCFLDEMVWIFGFDSARRGSWGGGGEICEDDLARFHARYEELDNQYPTFQQAFKIVFLHHHPLPVNPDNRWQERFLTMPNAGQFLNSVLQRRVDLVLHGHAHYQTIARLWRPVGAGDHEIAIVSLGATLLKTCSPDRNWFAVVAVGSTTAEVRFYPSIGCTFSESPDSGPFIVRSALSLAR